MEVAPPKAHEVRIEIYYTGVCHTGALSFFSSCNASVRGREIVGGWVMEKDDKSKDQAEEEKEGID